MPSSQSHRKSHSKPAAQSAEQPKANSAEQASKEPYSQNVLEDKSWEERIPRKYHRGGSKRFEMFLPPDLLADLQLMQQMTGNSFAAYIRRAVENALEADKSRWKKHGVETANEPVAATTKTRQEPEKLLKKQSRQHSRAKIR